MNIKRLKNKNIYINLLAFLYSFFIILFTSYKFFKNASLVFKNIFLTILSFLIFFLIIKYLIVLLFEKFDNYKTNDFKFKNKFLSLFDKHPFLFSLAIIIVLWLPYIISFYPIILSPDPSFQIMQYFKIPNKYMDYSIMLDRNVTITNHHPIIHTLLLGSLLKIGHTFFNDNFGLFLYSLVQILILSTTLSYSIYYMKKINVPCKYRFIVLLIYSLVPMFPFYAMSAVKDVIFSSLMILYNILIFDFIRNNKEKISLKKIIGTILLLVLICLFRNNGFYVILLSFPFLFFLIKKNKLPFILIYIFIISFNFTYNKVILPYYKITPTSIREALSIPFQQTARYVSYNEIGKEEYEIYDKILDMSDLKERYKENISDPVKNKYNKFTTSSDLKKYFKYWMLGFFKDPTCYIDATINNTYGYFYPFEVSWYIYYKYDTRIVQKGFNYHYNNLVSTRKLLSTYGIIYPFIPIIGLISSIGFNTWILIFMLFYFLYRKKYKYIVYLMPSFISLLVCIASPVNTYFRYAMPYIFSMPVLISFFLSSIQNKD